MYMIFVWETNFISVLKVGRVDNENFHYKFRAGFQGGGGGFNWENLRLRTKKYSPSKICNYVYKKSHGCLYIVGIKTMATWEEFVYKSALFS